MKSDGSFDCLLHSRNQTNPLLPPTWRPPAKPERPEVVRPELPELPTAVRPEIPDRPIAVKPVLPGRPEVVRPQLPELPTAVRPEIPDRPVAVKPVSPDRPEVVRPELPELPTAIRPEIPDRPVAIKPVLPERPEVVRPEQPIAVLPEQPVIVEASGAYYELSAQKFIDYCPDTAFKGKNEAGQPLASACPQLADALRKAPLTPGRDLVAETPVNIWVDTLYAKSRNRRGFAEVQDDSGTLSLGADYLLAPSLTAGMMVSVRKQDQNSLWGYVSTDATGWLLGPYLGYALSRQWSLFANISAGEIHRDHKVLSLKGESKAFQYAAMINLQGDYPISDNTLLRPKLGINYMNEAAREYQLSGTFLNRNITVATESKQRDSGQIQGSLEYSARFASGKNMVAPYAELGAIYNYLAEGPNDPEWQGLVRLGARMLIGPKTQIDFSTSYQSLGVNNLDTWDVRLFASWAFN